nr:hypothetical protein B0A51_08338 [Rachicladosporium sp. CCFEE 5018]
MAGFKSFGLGLCFLLLHTTISSATPSTPTLDLELLPQPPFIAARDAVVPLTLKLVNGLPSNNVYAYITTADLQTNQSILVTSTGAKLVPSPAKLYVPERVPSDCGILLGAPGVTTSVPVDFPLSNARVYFAAGEMEFWAIRTEDSYSLTNPSCESGKSGFIEVNQGADGMVWANPSFVDYVGLASPFELKSKTDNMTIESMPADGAARVCQRLKTAEETSAFPWSSLCKHDDKGAVYQVASPMHGNATLFNGYWNTTIDAVWNLIAKDGITFDLQSIAYGNVTCRMDADSSTMICDGISQPFSKPLSDHIWGCVGGPFTGANNAHGHIGSRLCAAFHRGTLLLPGGMCQPSQPASMYYQTGQIFNEYAKAVHAVSQDGRGYALSVDDVKAAIMGPEVAGLVGMKDVTELTIFVGGRAGQGTGPVASPSPYTAVASSPAILSLGSSANSASTPTAYSSIVTTPASPSAADSTIKSSTGASTPSPATLTLSMQDKGGEHTLAASEILTKPVNGGAMRTSWVTVTKVETAIVVQTTTVMVSAP